jgi:phosphoribosylamine---glycine ligase
MNAVHAQKAAPQEGLKQSSEINTNRSGLNRVIVVDHSGRGHAYVKLFQRTSPIPEIYYAPGCAVIKDNRIHNEPEIGLLDHEGLIQLAKRVKSDCAVIANTSAIASGLPDRFREAGIPTIGPSLRGARLEASKVFGKEMAVKYGVPVADHCFFDKYDDAVEYVKRCGYSVVVKADGLAAGLGTTVCNNVEDAQRALHELMVDKKCGPAGDRVVIERRMYGEEYSFSALVDGKNAILLPTSLDYPKPHDGNQGPTCGGVGAISPHPKDFTDLSEMAMTDLVEPTMRCLREEGIHYTGVLYFGAMLVEGKLKLLEYNVRMGDPEAGVVFRRIENRFDDLCLAILEGKLHEMKLEINDLTCCSVVAYQGRTKQISHGKNKGYFKGWPVGRYGKGYAISGLEDVDTTKCDLLFAQAALHPEKGPVSDGSRVLNFVGVGCSLSDARENAYNELQKVSFEGMSFRTDIGKVMPWE